MSKEGGKLCEMGCQLTFLASKQTNSRSPDMEFGEHAELVHSLEQENVAT